MNETFRPAAWSGVAISWTVAYTGVFLYFVVRVVQALTAGVAPDWFDLGAGVLLLILIVFAWARSVKGYRVADGMLSIDRRVIRGVSIPLNKLTSVQVDPAINSFFNTSVLGSGGLFGWGGRAGVRKANEIAPLVAYVYGSNPKNSVLLKSDDGKSIVVTPTNPQDFVSAMNKADTQRQFASARATGPGASRSKRK